MVVLFAKTSEFSEEIAKIKSIILTSYFITLIFNFSRFKMNLGLFRFFPPPPALLTKILLPPPPLADMLSWAVWFKFLLNKVIANTCLFILTSVSKQSASWKVLEICELCALSTDSQKTYSVNKYMYTGSSSSYSFDWGGGGNNPLGGGGGEETEKTHEFWKFLKTFPLTDVSADAETWASIDEVKFHY